MPDRVNEGKKNMDSERMKGSPNVNGDGERMRGMHVEEKVKKKK